MSWCLRGGKKLRCRLYHIIPSINHHHRFTDLIWFANIPRDERRQMRKNKLQKKKSSHNFLHNIIVTFSYCVPNDSSSSSGGNKKKVFILLARSHCHLSRLYRRRSTFNHPKSPPWTSHQIHSSTHVILLTPSPLEPPTSPWCYVPAHHFLCQRFFGYFINSIDTMMEIAVAFWCGTSI